MLSDNTPNPVHPPTTVRYATATDGPAEVLIHDASGRIVRGFHLGLLPAGEHAVQWDARGRRPLTIAEPEQVVTLPMKKPVSRRKPAWGESSERTRSSGTST